MNAARLLDFLVVLSRWSDNAWSLCKVETPALGKAGITGVIKVP